MQFLRDLFGFRPLHIDDIALTLAAGAVLLLVLEMLKPRWVAAKIVS
jgi:P-type Ca2+ transporter type 2C